MRYFTAVMGNAFVGMRLVRVGIARCLALALAAMVFCTVANAQDATAESMIARELGKRWLVVPNGAQARDTTEDAILSMTFYPVRLMTMGQQGGESDYIWEYGDMDSTLTITFLGYDVPYAYKVAELTQMRMLLIGQDGEVLALRWETLEEMEAREKKEGK